MDGREDGGLGMSTSFPALNMRFSAQNNMLTRKQGFGRRAHFRFNAKGQLQALAGDMFSVGHINGAAGVIELAHLEGRPCHRAQDSAAHLGRRGVLLTKDAGFSKPPCSLSVVFPFSS